VNGVHDFLLWNGLLVLPAFPAGRIFESRNQLKAVGSAAAPASRSW
jgi:hypothetical protein